MTLSGDVFRQVVAALILIPLTLSIQSAGMAALIVCGREFITRSTRRFGLFHSAELLIRFTTAMICLHTLQILVWAAFYRWECFPSFQRAFYFSAVSYSTVGYGDVILPVAWQLLGPLERVTGVLLCGLSASLLFALVTRLVGHE
jgi:voltage-gated potassium channel